ncbi:hypothetical protein, partial [Ralstonia pickettii]|uniref:hypothetical protein n=1 Tax=Ralstonia pickettii TaxID=329 RepID=UPI002D783A86
RDLKSGKIQVPIGATTILPRGVFAAHMNDWTGRKYLARRSLPCEAWLSTFSQWAGFIGVLPIPVDGYPSRL